MTRQTGYPPDIYPGYRCNDANISTHGFVNSRHMESHMDHALSVFFFPYSSMYVPTYQEKDRETEKAH